MTLDMAPIFETGTQDDEGVVCRLLRMRRLSQKEREGTFLLRWIA